MDSIQPMTETHVSADYYLLCSKCDRTWEGRQICLNIVQPMTDFSLQRWLGTGYPLHHCRYLMSPIGPV